jgi:hypothetical protein
MGQYYTNFAVATPSFQHAAHSQTSTTTTHSQSVAHLTCGSNTTRTKHYPSRFLRGNPCQRILDLSDLLLAWVFSGATAEAAS